MGKVTVDFTMPDGTNAKKEVPASHKDLRPRNDDGFSAMEEAAYKAWFDNIEHGASKKSAKSVAAFLSRSGVPRQALKQVWAVVNPGNDPEIGLEEFSRFCRLIGHCQAFGVDSQVVVAGDRALRVKLRVQCLSKQPTSVATFKA